MKPRFVNANVRACCPDCNGALTTFESKSRGNDFGSIIIDGMHQFNGSN